jgi:hypothetical protein
MAKELKFAFNLLLNLIFIFSCFEHLAFELVDFSHERDNLEIASLIPLFNSALEKGGIICLKVKMI